MTSNLTPPPPAEPPRDPAGGLDDRSLRLMHQYLADRDEPCPSCKYNLRNLRGDACPECGWRLRLRITTIEPSLAPWTILVASLCIGAGLGIPSVIFILLGALGEIGRNGRESFFGFSMVLFALCIPLALAAAFGRRRFLRWKEEAQYLVAVLACGAVALTILILIAIAFGRG